MRKFALPALLALAALCAADTNIYMSTATVRVTNGKGNFGPTGHGGDAKVHTATIGQPNPDMVKAGYTNGFRIILETGSILNVLRGNVGRNVTLPMVQIKYYDVDKRGHEKHVRTTVLTDVRVESYTTDRIEDRAQHRTINVGILQLDSKGVMYPRF